eukprot:5648886-Pleurochrysis_carterae.AAC.1
MACRSWASSWGWRTRSPAAVPAARRRTATSPNWQGGPASRKGRCRWRKAWHSARRRWSGCAGRRSCGGRGEAHPGWTWAPSSARSLMSTCRRQGRST